MEAYKEQEFKGKFDLTLWISLIKQALPQRKRMAVLALVMIMKLWWTPSFRS
jgi:hypothetical protein